MENGAFVKLILTWPTSYNNSKKCVVARKIHDHSTAATLLVVVVQAVLSISWRFSTVLLSFMHLTISLISAPSGQAASNWASSWPIHCWVWDGSVALLPLSTQRLQQNTAISLAVGFFLCFRMNYSMYLHPLNSSPSYTLNTSLAASSQDLSPTLLSGCSVLGWMCTSCSMCSLPNFQLFSAAGRAGTATLQSRKMSEKSLCSLSSPDTKNRSSLVRPAHQLGRRFLTSFPCSSSAAPSMGMNSLHTSTSLNLAVKLEVSTKKPLWQSPLKRVFSAFLWWMELRLNLSRKWKRARVLRQCLSNLPWMGYLRASTSLSMWGRSKRWKRKVSLSVGWLRKPLLTQYQRAISVLMLVEQN